MVRCAGRWGASSAVLLALMVGVGVTPQAATAKPRERPNIVVIVTDDQEATAFTPRIMPLTWQRLVRKGTRFSESFVTTPLCCPSRSTLITGQYAHNHGVMWNRPGYGHLKQKRNTLPVWLRRAGYRTVHLGRFLNGFYRWTGAPTAQAPGWTAWRTAVSGFYYHHVMAVNGGLRRFGSTPKAHLTRVLNEQAARVARRFGAKRRPLYLQIDHLAPHEEFRRQPSAGQCFSQAVPMPRDINAFSDEPLRRAPSFNEFDVSDKPAFIRNRRQIPDAAIPEMERRHRCRLESLLGVDRGVRKLFEALRSAGELHNTAFVFTSDNGVLAGEHRIRHDKGLPYEESIRVPLAIRLPRSMRRRGQPRVIDAPVANLDLTPTILGLAGAKPCRSRGVCRRLDGRSVLSELRRKGRLPRKRRLLIEAASGGKTGCFAFRGVRAPGDMYAEHRLARIEGSCRAIDEREHYDLRADPFQMENLFPASPSQNAARRQRDLKADLERLRDCGGLAGRDPRPRGGHFCE